MSTHSATRKITVPWVRAQKGKQKITALTAYDYPTALILDEMGIDIILVGDSVGTVIYGEPNTLSVTMEDMLRHTQAVTRAVKSALVVSDLPFLSYQVSIEQAVLNAGTLLKKAGAHAVKLEGGLEMAPTVKAITRAGIPVMGHIGLTPQSINVLGNYRTFGKTTDEQTYLVESAHALADAGAFSLVLECMTPALAQLVSQEVGIPTIGIGAGTECDGQILVTHDLVGLTSGHVPRFVNPLAALHLNFRSAVTGYIDRTKNVSVSDGAELADRP